MLRVLASTLGICMALVGATMAGHQPAPPDAVSRLTRAQLSNDSVIALLLSLVSQEQALIHAQLQALYEAGYVSTAPNGSASIGEYLSGSLVARYRASIPADVLSAMVGVQRVLTTELRAGGTARPARLQAGIVRAGSGLGRDRVDEFLENTRDWL